MNSKLCGIDLNGIQDFVAKNWEIKDGEEYFSKSAEEIVFIDGGYLSSVIYDNKEGFIGGMQADLAPHGKGYGWGEIGDEKNRHYIRKLKANNSQCEEMLNAAITGMVKNPSHAILSIRDSSETTEDFQDILLKALRKNRIKKNLLIWRSVLVVLNAIEKAEIKGGETIGVISHSLHGIDLQILKIKIIKKNNENYLVPERGNEGKSLITNFGYESLLEQAFCKLKENNIEIGDVALKCSNSIALLSLGLPAKNELLRKNNGNWHELSPKDQITFDEFFINENNDLDQYFNKCDKVIFESFSDGKLLSTIISFLEGKIKKDLIIKSGTSVAEGGLYASYRLLNDIDIYYDYLPQISTFVADNESDEIKNFDLIDQSETIKAGKLYKSAKPATLGLLAGKKTIDVYIKKENEKFPRKASIDINNPPENNVTVYVYVEQIPAGGKASIIIRSDGSIINSVIDWDDAKIINKEWNDIKKDIERDTPIPNRLVKPGDPVRWENEYTDGIQPIINQQVNAEHINWKQLASSISGAISSDGEIPDTVDEKTKANLNKLSKKALIHLYERINNKIDAKNESLKFLTWQYKYCLDADILGNLLIDLWKERNNKSFKHPFRLNDASWVLLFQGVGRIIDEEKTILRAIKSMLSIPINQWRYKEQTACMSFLLSRSESAPRLLTRENITILIKRVQFEFRENYNTRYTKFNYAPFLLAGLLRCRKSYKNLLLIKRDEDAEVIRLLINKTISNLKIAPVFRESYRETYIYWLKEILKYIEGEGGDPDILVDIYSNVSAS